MDTTTAIQTAEAPEAEAGTEVLTPEVVTPAEAPTPTRQPNVNPYEYMGCDVSDLTDLDEMLAAGGADFKVALATPVVNGEEATGFRAVVREDTGEVFAMPTGSYTIVQYRDIAQGVIDALTAKGLSPNFQTMGVIDGGRTFYASVLLDEFVLDPDGVSDTTQTFLNVYASHDGTIGVNAAYQAFRVICANQAPSLGKARFRVSVKHTKNADDRLGIAMKALGMAPSAAAQFQQDAKALQAMPTTTDAVIRRIANIYGDPNQMDEGRGRTRAENVRDRIVALYKGATCAGVLGNTRFAEFNAHTEYLDHGRLLGGEDPQGKMAKTTILPGTWVEKRKRDIGQMLLAA